MVKEVRSPSSLERGDFHAQRAISPGSRSSPSNAPRSDSGHLARSPGKGGGPASVSRRARCRSLVPAPPPELERALDRGMRGDGR
jgi:hypothetical protein